MSKLNEILGIEDGQEFEYKSRLSGCIKCKLVNGMRYTFDGYCWVGCTDEYILTEMVNHPERIKILPAKLKLTEQQIIAIKGRIAEGTLWAVKDISGEEIAFYSSTPCSEDYYATSMNVKLYDFLKVGQVVYLPDLLGDENNE